MRLTQSQTQMLGMLVVGLVLYMMFNRYQSHQQRGMFDNWVKAAETIVPQEAQDAVVAGRDNKADGRYSQAVPRKNFYGRC
jgi:hypothetical protein